MKKCSKCGNEKELTNFCKDNKRKDGISSWCMACKCKISKMWRDKNKEKCHNYSKKYAENNPISKMFQWYKSGAKKRGYSFELNLEQFEQLIKQPCHYCGKDGLNGIDRKDNSKGYILDNCLPCCAKCNIMKMDSTYDNFVQHIKNIFLHLNK